MKLREWLKPLDKATGVLIEAVANDQGGRLVVMDFVRVYELQSDYPRVLNSEVYSIYLGSAVDPANPCQDKTEAEEIVEILMLDDWDTMMSRLNKDEKEHDEQDEF